MHQKEAANVLLFILKFVIRCPKWTIGSLYIFPLNYNILNNQEKRKGVSGRMNI